LCLPIKIGNNLIDNEWVVLYNPYISTKYNAHVNVEICSTIKVVYYLYKYIYKGHDKIVHAISNNTGLFIIFLFFFLFFKLNFYKGEISQYQESIYISAAESCWRIFHFSLQNQYPNVYQLSVHLENEQIQVCLSYFYFFFYFSNLIFIKVKSCNIKNQDIYLLLNPVGVFFTLACKINILMCINYLFI
jgi:hypothetical protein